MFGHQIPVSEIERRISQASSLSGLHALRRTPLRLSGMVDPLSNFEGWAYLAMSSAAQCDGSHLEWLTSELTSRASNMEDEHSLGLHLPTGRRGNKRGYPNP